jgi:bacterial/archaeal transporter family protein
MWIVYSTAAALFAALVILFSKLGIQKIDPTVVFGIETLCMAIITWSIVFSKKLTHQIFTMDRRIWVFILAAGILTTLSSLASFHSLKIGHASRTSSFEKVSLVFSVGLSILFLKDKFNWQIGVGVILMAAGCLFVAFSDTAKS